MAVYKQRKSDKWWYKFRWNGELIRESTKQSNKRVAEQMEAAHKTALAKGEVGIRERKPVPTLKQFAERDFVPFVESHFAEKPTTVAYYKNRIGHLTGHADLANCPLDEITQEKVMCFVTNHRDAKYEVSSTNRCLQVLRRMTRLAVEWGRTEKAPTRISLLPGEKRRERVLTGIEEDIYLKAAAAIGDEILADYTRALNGVRAAHRGQQPIKPEDPYLLRDVATILLDCGLRPEECHRLRWEDVRRGLPAYTLRQD
jgi:integrase